MPDMLTVFEGLKFSVLAPFVKIHVKWQWALGPRTYWFKLLSQRISAPIYYCCTNLEVIIGHNRVEYTCVFHDPIDEYCPISIFLQFLQENETRQKLQMQQQQQEVKENQQKKTQNAQAAMMSELKSNIAVKRPKDSRKIGKDEIYHGALEDILTGLCLFNARYLDLVSTEMN